MCGTAPPSQQSLANGEKEADPVAARINDVVMPTPAEQIRSPGQIVSEFLEGAKIIAAICLPVVQQILGDFDPGNPRGVLPLFVCGQDPKRLRVKTHLVWDLSFPNVSRDQRALFTIPTIFKYSSPRGIRRRGETLTTSAQRVDSQTFAV